MNISLASTVTLRAYAKPDLDHCVRIWRDASLVGHPFLAPTDIAADECLVRDTYIPMARMTVAEQEGRIVGFIAMIDSFIGALFVDPDHHGLGIGRALVAAEAERQVALSVEVYEQNRRARAFYRACGFVEIGFREVDDQGRPFPLIGMELKPPRVNTAPAP